jgi:hypothetical protein
MLNERRACGGSGETWRSVCWQVRAAANSKRVAQMRVRVQRLVKLYKQKSAE